MKAHIIQNGKITNTIVVESLNDFPNLVAATAGTIGDLWIDNSPVKPPKYASLAEAIEARTAEVLALRTEKTFSDASVTFPDAAVKDIQIENEMDLFNLLANAVAGLAQVVSGKPNESMTYRTKDKSVKPVKASEMVTIGLTIMAQKQAVVSAAWAHEDAINALTTIAAVEAYDITTGWPE